MPKTLASASSLAKAFSKTADRRFNSDFVAVFKAVRHCFGHAVHPHWDAINSHIDHTLRQRIAREARETQAQSLHHGLSSLSINGHPDYIGVRIENSMKAKRRFETNDSVRDAPAGDCDPTFEVKRTSCGKVQATIELGEQTEVQCSSHDLMVNSMRLEFAERDRIRRLKGDLVMEPRQDANCTLIARAIPKKGGGFETF
jgi:hypothetical protein